MSTDLPFVNLGRVFRNGWLLMLICVVLMCALGVIGWNLYPEKYDATATVEVTAPNNADTANLPNMQTEQSIVGSTGVLVAALKDLNGWTLEDLQNGVSVTVPHNADVLDITVSDGNPASAARAANAVAEAYLDDRRNESDSKHTATLKQLEQQIALIEQQIGNTSSPVKRQQLEAPFSTLQGQYAAARANVDEPGRILSSAQIPSSPSTPGLVLWLAATGLAGLLIGFYASTVRERIRRSRVE